MMIILLVSVCSFEPILAEKTVTDSAKVEKAEVKKADLLTVKRQVKTRYDIFGRVVNQVQNAKGLHSITGSCKLVAGIDTISLNTSTANNKQDISFLNQTSYSGRSWSLSASNTNRYWIVPLSSTKFIVKSSDGADTATVRFEVRGE